MPSKLRTKRIADRIQQLLSEMLITGKISDPRLASVFITDVTVDRELSFAKIFVSSLEGKSQSDEILLLPLLPHLSSTYSLVLPPTVVVALCLDAAHQAVLSVDGHINLPLSGGAVVTVKHSSEKTRFLRIHPETSFYSSLEKKLKGKRYVEPSRKS